MSLEEYQAQIVEKIQLGLTRHVVPPDQTPTGSPPPEFDSVYIASTGEWLPKEAAPVFPGRVQILGKGSPVINFCPQNHCRVGLCITHTGGSCPSQTTTSVPVVMDNYGNLTVRSCWYKKAGTLLIMRRTTPYPSDLIPYINWGNTGLERAMGYFNRVMYDECAEGPLHSSNPANRACWKKAITGILTILEPYFNKFEPVMDKYAGQCILTKPRAMQSPEDACRDKTLTEYTSELTKRLAQAEILLKQRTAELGKLELDAYAREQDLMLEVKELRGKTTNQSQQIAELRQAIDEQKNQRAEDHETKRIAGTLLKRLQELADSVTTFPTPLEVCKEIADAKGVQEAVHLRGKYAELLDKTIRDSRQASNQLAALETTNAKSQEEISTLREKVACLSSQITTLMTRVAQLTSDEIAKVDDTALVLQFRNDAEEARKEKDDLAAKLARAEQRISQLNALLRPLRQLAL